jgi:predicted RNA polymerase sigma factor
VDIHYVLAASHGGPQGWTLRWVTWRNQRPVADTDPRLASHYRLDAVRAHLLKKTGDYEAAIEHYRLAAARTTSIPERNYLMTQAARLAGD